MNINDEAERFDIESALKRFSNDTELLTDAIAIFKEESVKHLSKIKEYLQTADLEGIAAEAHTLKSECGAVGAVAGHFLCDSLEKYAQANNFAVCAELFSKVEEEVHFAVEKLPDHLS